MTEQNQDPKSVSETEASSSSPANNPNPSQTLSRLVREFLVFLRGRMSLDGDKADPEETVDYIRKGVEFEGTNIWILVFAILIASIGLNMNSTAVVIGAMLISPLMGPIMGVGMGVGINDIELIKKSAKNLGLMVGISVFTSTVYFLISPISDAQSELLARTQPTIWDVLIALFGGLAGIVAGSRKEKSNAIPGVAIATALMPPLCTAGFGLASGNFTYFAGAFYLFTINSVFISVSTVIIVRYLKYPHKEFIDAEKEKKAKRWIGILILVVTLPSLWIAFNLVRNSVFEREAGIFVRDNFVFDNTQVISKNIVAEGDVRRIEVALIGELITSDRIEDLERKMKTNDRLKDVDLIVRQGGIIEQGLDLSDVERINKEMKAGIIEDLYKKNEDALKSKDDRIETLEDEVFKLQSQLIPVADFTDEMLAINDNVKEFTLMNNAIVNLQTNSVDTVLFAYIEFKKRPLKSESEQFEKYLRARLDADSLKLVVSY